MVLDTLAAERCSAILRTPHAGAVRPAMEAAVEGGFRVVEFTLNTPGALEEIRRFAQRPELVVGAGTVLSVDDAAAAVDAGARFLVSPVTDPAVIGWCRDRGVVSIPGAFTPTEMLTAWRAGADVVKLFPGPPDGPSYLRSILGPLPELRLFPTSGVTLENCGEYLRAGAFGVGFVGCLFDPDDLAASRFDAIRDRAEAMVAAIQAATV